MSVTVLSGLSKDYFLRNYYKADINARDKSGRTSIKDNDKTIADSAALKKALKSLENVKYDSDEKDGEVYNKFIAYINTYNNMLESGGDSSSADIKKIQKSMKSLTKKYEEDFKRLGVTLKSDGKLKMENDMADKFTMGKMEKLFSHENGAFRKELTRLASKSYTNSYNLSKMSKDGIDVSV